MNGLRLSLLQKIQSFGTAYSYLFTFVLIAVVIAPVVVAAFFLGQAI